MQRCAEDNTKCIPHFWYCDGIADCPLGTDEIDCDCSKLNMEECITPDNTSECIPTTWACAGLSFCVNFDESVCRFEMDDDENFPSKSDLLCNINEVAFTAFCEGKIIH